MNTKCPQNMFCKNMEAVLGLTHGSGSIRDYNAFPCQLHVVLCRRLVAQEAPVAVSEPSIAIKISTFDHVINRKPRYCCISGYPCPSQPVPRLCRPDYFGNVLDLGLKNQESSGSVGLAYRRLKHLKLVAWTHSLGHFHHKLSAILEGNRHLCKRSRRIRRQA